MNEDTIKNLDLTMHNTIVLANLIEFSSMVMIEIGGEELATEIGGNDLTKQALIDLNRSSVIANLGRFGR